MKWGEIQLAALKKMDPAITSLTPTRNTKDYLNGMVAAANRGLFDLSTAGKFIVKEYYVNIPDNPNLIQGAQRTVQHLNENIAYEVKSAKAYYCEATGPATVNIYVDGILTMSKEIESHNEFEVVKGLIPNNNEKMVKIEFSGLYPYQFKNVALYNVQFKTDNDVWDCSPTKRIQLKKEVPDFYKLVTTDVVRETNGTYIKYRDYAWEGDSTLIVDGLNAGNYKVHYFAYPAEIREDTPNSYELELDPEVAVLLPIYIAAELLEDDDSSMAYYIREQYMEAKKKLIPTQIHGQASFIDRWGWS